MFTKRIIPCLDVKDGRVVKGVNFVGLKDAGDPVEIAKAYDAAGADELIFLDITASSDQRKTVVDMVRDCLLYTSVYFIIHTYPALLLTFTLFFTFFTIAKMQLIIQG